MSSVPIIGMTLDAYRQKLDLMRDCGNWDEPLGDILEYLKSHKDKPYKEALLQFGRDKYPLLDKSVIKEVTRRLHYNKEAREAHS